MCASPSTTDVEESTALTEDSLLFDGPRTTYGRFRVLHQIGAGSVGPVFRGEEPATRRPVVIKALRVGLPPERVAIVASALASLRERLTPHPSLCPMLDSGVQEAEPYVVWAFVDGDSLDVALREYGPANITDALPRLRTLADALDTAAAVGGVHGSLHLRDIIVSPEHTVLTGLGVAPILERVGVRPPIRRPYCAPEVMHGHGMGPTADVFALAAIAHEWLSGRRISGPGAEGFHLPGATPAGTEAVTEVFCRALDEHPDDRFQTATAFVDALAEVSDALAPRTRVARRRAAAAEAPRLAFDFLEDPKPDADRAAVDDTPVTAAPTVATTTPAAFSLAADPVEADDMVAALEAARSASVDPIDPPLERAAGVDHPMADALAIDLAPAPGPAIGESRGDEAARYDDVDAPADETPAPAPAAPPGTSTPGKPSVFTRDPDEFRRVEPSPPVERKPRDLRPAAVATDDDREALARVGAWPASPFAWAVILVVLAAVAVVGGMTLVRWGTPSPPAPSVATADATGARDDAPAPPAAAAQPPITPPAAPDGPAAPPPSAAAAPPGAEPTPPRESNAAPPRAATPSPSPPSPAPPATATPKAVPARRAGTQGTANARPAPPVKSRPAAAPPAGRLLVRSTPGGAEVFVNGTRRGVTPLALRDLPLGAYAVRVGRAGFTPVEQRVTLDSGRPSRTVEVALSRSAPPAPTTPASAAAPNTPGSLLVETRPPGARVIVGGREVGRTPVTLPSLPPGEHAVRIELDGYQPITTTARVEAGARARLAVSLTSERPLQR